MEIRILFALLACTIGAFVSCSSVQDITEEALSDIRSSQKIWLVYTPADTNDPNLKILQDTSDVLSGFFKIGVLPPSGTAKLDLYADNGQTKEYSGNFNVDQLVDFALSNTEAVIKARSKIADDAKAYNDFKAKEVERAKKEWEDQQNLRIKSNTLVITSDNFDSAFLKQRDPFFINFYQSNCSACIQLNKQWEAVANELKGRAIVAKINITDSHQLEERFKFQNYPVIRFYPAGVKNVNEFVAFDGIYKKFSIMEWASARLSQKKTSVEIPELNKENYESLCKSTKATCVILFADNIDEISGKTGELAAKYLKKPISFLVSKKGSETQFEKNLQITSAPDTLMIYCKGKKMLKMGGMDFTQIDETINEITLGNRNGFVPYKIADPFA